MKLLSLFDGEGGFPLAAVMNGIEPVAASEIEPYPIAITRSRFPKMKHLGDIALVNGADIEPVDIATFGSPCQSMSVAGKREGLKHESQGDEETTRSGMFFEAIRIMTEMREATNGQYPRFAVWENVPGAFSSGGGRDFLAVLQAIAAIAEPSVSIPEPERDSKTDNLIWFSAGSIVGNGWSIAWRTLDAQYWGVPQRRKRIYLVADFGSERAAEILFERYSLHGNFTESGEARKETPADAVGRADRGAGDAGRTTNQGGVGRVDPSVYNESGQGYWMPGFGCLRAEGENRPSRPSNCIVYPATARTLAARYDSSPCDDRGQNVVVQDRRGVVAFAQNQRDEVRDLNGVAGALAAESGMKQQTFIVQPVIALQANGIDRADTAGCNGAGWREDQSYTLNTVDRHAVCYPDVSGTLQANSGAPREGRGNDVICYPQTVGTLAASGAGCSRTAGQGNEADFCVVSKSDSARRYIVRRLMPIETTRLQGFPDFWHDLAPFDGDVEFWESVRKTWARINGIEYKPFKTVERLEKWYYKLRNDGAEYKADGNSLAIPCAECVIRRIAETVREEEKLSAEETI